MNLLLVGAAIVGLVLGVLLSLYYKYTESGRRTMAKYNSQESQDWFYRANPDFNPETGEWEDWDGTSYGAIDDLLMDADDDGDWDDFDDGWADFDGDGMPDDWD